MEFNEELIPDEIEYSSVNDDADLTPPLPEVTKGLTDDTEASEAEMPTSSPRSFGCGDGSKAPRGKLYAYDWLQYIPKSHNYDMVRVQFKNTRSGFYRNDQQLDLKPGDMVAVEANPGHDIGEVVMTGPLVSLQMRKAGIKPTSDIKRIFRLAKPADIEKYEEAIAREHETMIKSRKIAEDLGLNMKIGDVEYQGDGGKAIFYYIADERVDFRKLIRILAETFRIRVEMKQIGARQEAGRIGGIGPCGRPLCCASWLSNFVSVGTSAARYQDISMNPQKLAGQCGKLKCCLNFEVDNYIEAGRKLPPKDTVLFTADGEYHLFKSDILSGDVTYSTDKAIPSNLVTIPSSRAFEIIALNRQGVKPEALSTTKPDDETPTGFVNMIGQDSLTRFDKNKKKKKKKNRQNAEIATSSESGKQPKEKKNRPDGGERSPKNINADSNQPDRKNPRPAEKANEKGENRRQNSNRRSGKRYNDKNGQRNKSNSPRKDTASAEPKATS